MFTSLGKANIRGRSVGYDEASPNTVECSPSSCLKPPRSRSSIICDWILDNHEPLINFWDHKFTPWFLLGDPSMVRVSHKPKSILMNSSGNHHLFGWGFRSLSLLTNNGRIPPTSTLCGLRPLATAMEGGMGGELPAASKISPGPPMRAIKEPKGSPTPTPRE